MSSIIDFDLIRSVIAKSGIEYDKEETAQLIHDLIDEEFNVQHQIRPQRILIKIREHLDEFNSK